MQVTQNTRNSTGWLSAAVAYGLILASLAAFIFFSVDETRALLG